MIFQSELALVCCRCHFSHNGALLCCILHFVACSRIGISLSVFCLRGNCRRGWSVQCYVFPVVCIPSATLVVCQVTGPSYCCEWQCVLWVRFLYTRPWCSFILHVPPFGAANCQFAFCKLFSLFMHVRCCHQYEYLMSVRSGTKLARHWSLQKLDSLPVFVFLQDMLPLSVFFLKFPISFLSMEFNPYPTAFPYGNGMVLHFYQQQESSTTKTVHKVINKRLKAYV